MCELASSASIRSALLVKWLMDTVVRWGRRVMSTVTTPLRVRKRRGVAREGGVKAAGSGAPVVQEPRRPGPPASPRTTVVTAREMRACCMHARMQQTGPAPTCSALPRRWEASRPARCGAAAQQCPAAQRGEGKPAVGRSKVMANGGACQTGAQQRGCWAGSGCSALTCRQRQPLQAAPTPRLRTLSLYKNLTICCSSSIPLATARSMSTPQAANAHTTAPLLLPTISTCGPGRVHQSAPAPGGAAARSSAGGSTRRPPRAFTPSKAMRCKPNTGEVDDDPTIALYSVTGRKIADVTPPLTSERSWRAPSSLHTPICQGSSLPAPGQHICGGRLFAPGLASIEARSDPLDGGRWCSAITSHPSSLPAAGVERTQRPSISGMQIDKRSFAPRFAAVEGEGGEDWRRCPRASRRHQRRPRPPAGKRFVMCG
jgi:hypothetical protein